MKNASGEESLFPKILTSRPEGMEFKKYRELLKNQKGFLRFYLERGRKATIKRLTGK